MLYPPTETPPGGMWPSYSQLTWLQKIAPTLSASDPRKECMHNEGEILYLPEGWYHAVTNVEETVAVAVQDFERQGSYFDFLVSELAVNPWVNTICCPDRYDR